MAIILTANEAHELLSAIVPFENRAMELQTMGQSLASDRCPWARELSREMLADAETIEAGIKEMLSGQYDPHKYIVRRIDQHADKLLDGLFRKWL